jgi:hypothetical protein
MAKLFDNQTKLQTIKERVHAPTYNKLVAMIGAGQLNEDDLKLTDNEESYGIRYDVNGIYVNCVLSDASISKLCDQIESLVESV